MGRGSPPVRAPCGPLSSPGLAPEDRMRDYRRFRPAIPHTRPDAPRVPHPSAAPAVSCPTASARLACIRHAASVRPEPGSNSPEHRTRHAGSPPCADSLLDSCCSSDSVVKVRATLQSSAGRTAMAILLWSSGGCNTSAHLFSRLTTTAPFSFRTCDARADHIGTEADI